MFRCSHILRVEGFLGGGLNPFLNLYYKVPTVTTKISLKSVETTISSTLDFSVNGVDFIG